MIDVKLDMQGRLVEFIARPLRVEPLSSPSEIDLPWDGLFRRAGLDRSRFSLLEGSIDPVWNAPVDCDQRWTWVGTLGDEDSLSIRVEAGSHRGRVAAFEILAPWNVPTPRSSPAVPRSVRFVDDVTSIVGLLMTGFLIVIGVRNFRRGRGDRRGSYRIGLFIVVSHMGFWLLGCSRLPQVFGGFLAAASLAMAISLFWGVIGWLFYMALEPYLRRWCPHRIISWSRLLAGRWKDPLVGRDILVGVTVGVALSVGGDTLVNVIRSSLDLPEAITAARDLPLGLQHTVAGLMLFGIDGIAGGLLTTFVPLVVQFVVRKAWITVALMWVIFTLFSSLPLWSADSAGTWALLTLVVGGIRAAAFAYVVLRVGLLASSACLFVSMAFWSTGTSSLGEWHGQPTLTTIIAIACLGIFGYVHSLAGRRLFRDSLDSSLEASVRP